NSVSDQAAPPGRHGAGNVGSPVYARPSRVPVRARSAAGHSGHVGSSAETEQPAVRARPSQVPARAGGVPGPSLGYNVSRNRVRAGGAAGGGVLRPKLAVSRPGDDYE